MTTAEFNLIEKSYKKEHERWKNLSVGQFVYVEFGRYMEMEFFMCVITDIDVDNRMVGVIDFNQNEKPIRLSGFRTIQELKDRGIEFKEPTQRQLEVSKLLIRECTKSYKCDMCDEVHILDQSKIIGMEMFHPPYGCQGGGYHKQDHYFFYCKCMRPIEVRPKDVNHLLPIPKIREPHGRGRCSLNVKKDYLYS